MNIYHVQFCLCQFCFAISVLTPGRGHVLPQDGTGNICPWLFWDMTVICCELDPKLLLRSAQGWCWNRNRSSSWRMLRHEGCHRALGFLWPLATIFTDHLLCLLNLPTTATKSHLPFNNFFEMLISLCSDTAHFSWLSPSSLFIWSTWAISI